MSVYDMISCNANLFFFEAKKIMDMRCYGIISSAQQAHYQRHESLPLFDTFRAMYNGPLNFYFRFPTSVHHSGGRNQASIHRNGT